MTRNPHSWSKFVGWSFLGRPTAYPQASSKSMTLICHLCQPMPVHKHDPRGNQLYTYMSWWSGVHGQNCKSYPTLQHQTKHNILTTANNKQNNGNDDDEGTIKGSKNNHNRSNDNSSNNNIKQSSTDYNCYDGYYSDNNTNHHQQQKTTTKPHQPISL